MTKRRSPIKKTLLEKSQESALSAIQTFNNPLIKFKSEIFIVLMIIAWTYLLHAYYRTKKVDMRYLETDPDSRNKYKKVGDNYKLWELSSCLKYKHCPLEQGVKDNLNFLIGVRNEIEHTGTHELHHVISAKFQACCINYNQTIKSLFGNGYALDKILPISLQLFSFGESQIDGLKNIEDLPKNLIDFISDFESSIQNVTDPSYSYKVLYTRLSANNQNQADSHYTFLDEASPEAKEIEVILKNKNRKQLLEREVVQKIKEEGFIKFNAYKHQQFWKTLWNNKDDRNKKAKEFGVLLGTDQWLWFEDAWIPKVREYCNENTEKFI